MFSHYMRRGMYYDWQDLISDKFATKITEEARYAFQYNYTDPVDIKCESESSDYVGIY